LLGLLQKTGPSEDWRPLALQRVSPMSEFDRRIHQAMVEGAATAEAMEDSAVAEAHDAAGYAMQSYCQLLLAHGLRPSTALAQATTLAGTAWFMAVGLEESIGGCR
jgi:hypothetical protein